MKNSGQALIELVMLLIGFTALLLGIIFTCGLELSNNELLLSAKLNANLRATYGGSTEMGREIKRWHYMEFDGVEIPFSGQDRPVYALDSMVAGHAYELKAPERSEAQNYYYNYSDTLLLDHGVKSYRNLNNNAYDLANLVRGIDSDLNREVIYSIRYYKQKNQLYRALPSWCGVRVDQNTLKDNPSNQVFMPQNIQP